MSDRKNYIKEFIRMEFMRGRNAEEACETICSALGEGVVTRQQCRYWYGRFEIGEFDIDDVTVATIKPQSNKREPKKME